MCTPKKFNLVHQTVSPRERVGSGDETSPNPWASGSIEALQLLV